MSKIRLNADMRKDLLAYAQSVIAFPADEAAIQQLYREAQGAARAAIQRRYPLADMLVLAKYDAARQRDNYRFCCGSGQVVSFKFNEETGPIAKDSYNMTSCEQDEFNKFYAYYRAVEALAAKSKQLLTDYENLLKASRSFEELIEVWPEAEVMRDSIEGRAGKRAISNLSAEAIARIKVDVAARKETA